MQVIAVKVQTCMSSNRLRLSPFRKERSTWQARARIDREAITAEFADWEVDLGLLLDEDISMEVHFSSRCRSCFYYQIRQIIITVMRENLSFAAAATLVHSLILTRLDYCNSLLVGLLKFRIRQLQSVTNCAAWIVPNLTNFSHAFSYMREKLHWLPVEDRRTYKILIGRTSIVGAAPYNDII